MGSVYSHCMQGPSRLEVGSRNHESGVMARELNGGTTGWVTAIWIIVS